MTLCKAEHPLKLSGLGPAGARHCTFERTVAAGEAVQGYALLQRVALWVDHTAGARIEERIAALASTTVLAGPVSCPMACRRLCGFTKWGSFAKMALPPVFWAARASRSGLWPGCEPAPPAESIGVTKQLLHRRDCKE
jgi:hypothetical protein